MFDFIGMVITAALMVLVVNTLTTYMDAPRVARTALAAVIGVWIGLAAAVAGAGSAQGDAEHTDARDGRA